MQINKLKFQILLCLSRFVGLECSLTLKNVQLLFLSMNNPLMINAIRLQKSLTENSFIIQQCIYRRAWHEVMEKFNTIFFHYTTVYIGQHYIKPVQNHCTNREWGRQNTYTKSLLLWLLWRTSTNRIPSRSPFFTDYPNPTIFSIKYQSHSHPFIDLITFYLASLSLKRRFVVLGCRC